MSVARAEQIADAVLCEGYLLYPYRASAAKNRLRWPFGVVAPRAWGERHEGERWVLRTDCLLDDAGAASLDLRIRWLRVRHRRVEAASGMPGADLRGDRTFVPVPRLQAGGEDLVAWDEGVDCVADVTALPLADLLTVPHVHEIALTRDESIELVPGELDPVGRVIRLCEPLHASVTVSAARAGTLVRVSVRIENTTPIEGTADRDTALRRAMTSTHVILSVKHGTFTSLVDPPPEAHDTAAACVNDGLWPVLIGPAPARDVLLAAPIILYDYPAVAAESPGDLCDGTEIDEILTLRIMTLTDAEKQEARATDPRARHIIDRTDALPPDALERLHGTFRRTDTPDAALQPEAARFAPFDLPPGEAPGDATLTLGGVCLARGSAVVLRPRRRADAMDMFLDGRLATVAGIYTDVGGRTHVAVTVDSDPARELHEALRRYFYFAPDEVIPVGATGHAPGTDHEVTR